MILVHGPTAVAPPNGVERVKVRSALDMHAAVFAALPSRRRGRDDRRGRGLPPGAGADAEDQEAGADRLTIELVKNPDILRGPRRASAGARKRPVLVGFAMETNDLLAYARRKLVQEACDLIVANEAEVGFGGDDNQATLVGPDGDEPLPKMSKRELADRILDRVAALLAAKPGSRAARAPRLRPRSPKARRPRAPRPALRPKGR